MNAPLQLREYQWEPIKELFGYFSQKHGFPLVLMPTGTGKSLVIGGYIREVLLQYVSARILVLTHVKELVKQNSNKLVELWADAPMSIFSAGLGIKNATGQVVFGGVKSVFNSINLLGRRDIILVDECHLISPTVTTIYQKLIEHFRQLNPNLVVIGFTATGFRTGLGMLTDPEDGMFTDIVCDQTTPEWWSYFFANGYLVPPINKRMATQLDVSGVGINAAKGDYKLGELQQAVNTNDLNYRAVQELCHYGTHRHKWLMFCSGIEHAEEIAQNCRQQGFPIEAIHTGLGDKERDRRLLALRDRRIRGVTNFNILTTGFDDPEIDLIGMLRPTVSTSLWIQMLGRGTRPCPWMNKFNCLVLDYTQNTRTLGPIDYPRIPKKKGKSTGDAPIKECDNCCTWNYISARYCVECGAEFIFEEKIHHTASNADVLKTTVPDAEWFDITSVSYAKHEGRSNHNLGKIMVRVDYHTTAIRLFHDWIDLQSSKSFVRHRAHEFFRRLYDEREVEMPGDNKTLLQLLRRSPPAQPKRIYVHVNAEPFPKVLRCEF